jgi:DNA-binding NtrC family response regulator
MGIKILVIDDDEVACELLQETLQRAGHEVVTRLSAEAALREALDAFDLLISDIRMPGMDGLEFLRRVHEQLPDLPVILMTAYGSLETTMEALRIGAWDYISKPFPPEAIRAMVQKIIEVRQLRRRQAHGEPKTIEAPHFIGSSAIMVDFYKSIARVADSWASVLVEGESGTGKELAARSLHLLSSRHQAPFVAVHCGAIPDTLLESELFGFEKGAFTGADQKKEGLIETARGGTLFLDEITEMSPALQAKLLRFMQNREVRRLGGHDTRQVTVRVVAAANRDIEAEITRGSFRADLLYRFVVRLHIPALREHKDDLPQLVKALLKKLGYSKVRLSSEAMECLMAYDWPGNVRELENLLHQTLLLAPYEVVFPENFPERLRTSRQSGPASGLSPLDAAERAQILETLKACTWNQSKAAQALGIDRKTLRSKIQRYALVKE